MGLGHLENLDRNILIPNNWDLKGNLPAGISKIGIKQHLLIEHNLYKVHYLLPWLLISVSNK